MSNIKITYINFILAFVLSLSSCVTHAQVKSTDIKTINGKKYYIHKVEKGQSLYAIAKTYNMDVNAILAENDEAIDGLKNGQELKIPFETVLSKPVTAIDTNKYIYHRVLKGETIYSITKKYGIDEKKLASYNPTLSNGLKEGEFVIVGENKKTISTKPVQTATASINPNIPLNYTTYIVQQGETMYGLTKKFNVTQDNILKWNPETKDGIKQGQVLKIAVSSNQSAVTSTTIVTNVINTIKDTIPFNSVKKQKYEIGLFLPFKLAESEMLNIEDLARAKAPFPATQSLALDFYFGFKTAVDSLLSNDFDVNINLYDMEDRDSAKIETICKSAEFKKLDVIFGPLYLSGFKIVSNYAKENGIPVVSPVIQQNKILYQNKLVSKVCPSLYSMIEELSLYCSDSLMVTSNIMIVNPTVKDLSYIKAFKNEYNANLSKHGKTFKDSIITVKGIAGVKAAFVPNKKNVVVLLTNNQVYLQDFITQLYSFSDKKDIVLMGFSSVSNIDNLDQEYLNKLSFHFADANHLDYTQPLTIQLTKHYQEFYFSDPSDYYFQGYDIATYYLSNLKTQGSALFLNLDKTPWQGVSTYFKFFRPDAETGFENRGISIYKYSEYKLQKLGWK